MTVEELIKELQKHPPKSRVVFQDHDQGEGEFNNYINYVTEEGSRTVLRP